MAKLITYWVIRHKPTGRILATPQSTRHGRANTRVDIRDDGIPRMFLNEQTAKRCLGKWLEGEFSYHWEDGIEVDQPAIPRVREHMEVIPVQLKVMV